MKRFFLLSLSAILWCVSGSAGQSRFFTPFQYMHYDCVGGTGVKSLTVTENGSGKTEVYYFRPDGGISSIYGIAEGDTSKVASYVYKGDKLVDIDRHLERNELKYNKAKQLCGIQTYELWNSKSRPAYYTVVEYDENNLPVRYFRGKEPSPTQDPGDYEAKASYKDGKRVSYTETVYDSDQKGFVRNDYKYDENGVATGYSVYKDGTFIRKVQFTHKYDDHGNWIVRKALSGRSVLYTVTRNLTYYTAEETASAVVVEKNTGKSALGAYFSDMKDRIVTEVYYNYDGGIVLISIVLLMTLAGMIYVLIRMIDDPPFNRHVLGNGMKRLWMYDSSRYLNVLVYFGVAFLCFLASILVIALVGGVLWLLAWILKIIVHIIIVFGWICTIIGVLGLIGKAGEALIPLIIGIIILSFKNSMKIMGNAAVDWSFAFLKRINMIGWGFNLCVSLWDVILLIFLSPVVLFLSVAAVIIVLNTLLNGIEWAVTRIYSIHRPCPSCGSTKTPDYIVGGRIHPVKLHPGMFGIFYQHSPVTGQAVPTMLLNGKGRLSRRCPSCGTIINSDTEKSFGTDIHIGLVGHRSSGKSYLLYTGLSSLKNAYPYAVSQIDADMDTRIEDKQRRIAARAGIQTNVANRYRAVQLMVTSRHRPVPYHLFFYDVAGEKFNASSSSYKTAMDFYRNVQSIVFVIDPGMIDYTGIPVNDKVRAWAEKSPNRSELYRIDNSFSVLKDILESVGRNPARIDFTFVCTKSDTGYFEAAGISRKSLTEAAIENFIRRGLGLENLVNSAVAAFNDVHYFETSVTEGSGGSVRALFEFLLKQRKVSF